MIRSDFLSDDDREALHALVRNGSAASRFTRRANAILLLNKGWSCSEVSQALFLDDDTIRSWYKLYEQDGLAGLQRFSAGGSASFLNAEQEAELKAWMETCVPRSTCEIGAWIEKKFGIVYESRSGLAALLHKLGFKFRKPKSIPRQIDEDKQKVFIEHYHNLMNSVGDDEAVVFVDAVHPTHEARPVGCWTPKDEPIAIAQTSGRQRLNIHGAIDLETGQTRMIEVETVDAASTIRLLQAIAAAYPTLILIHVILDNARYHHAKLVQEWLRQSNCRIKLHFLPSYCPHLNPIERLWGIMHKHVTHNKSYPTYTDFARSILKFLRHDVPQKWKEFADSVTDNFRVIQPSQFRVLT